jgi:hypothetical protein
VLRPNDTPMPPPASIAQLGQLDDRGRRRFGRGTLALTKTILIAGIMYLRWAHAGRPHGIDAIERDAETDPDDVSEEADAAALGGV